MHLFCRCLFLIEHSVIVTVTKSVLKVSKIFIMDGQPMLQSTATSTNNTIEEVSVGCVMHRYKGYKAKRVSFDINFVIWGVRFFSSEFKHKNS